MPVELEYLFRRGRPHVFLCANRPEARYDLVCGRCDFPLTAWDQECPRCRRELEVCPVCSEVRHHRVPKVEAAPRTKEKVCPSCSVRRRPFGDPARIARIDGTYCRNLFGCPAGGLLLKSQEIAVLDADASLCPVCRHDELKPLAMPAFRERLNECLFCSTCLRRDVAWPAERNVLDEPLERLGTERMEDPRSPCLQCGRRDYQMDATHIAIPHAERQGPISIPIGKYLRVAELGRILILEPTNEGAFKAAFRHWTENGPSAKDEGVPVHELFDLLLGGTHDEAMRDIVSRRLEVLAERWKGRMGDEVLKFSVAFAQPPQKAGVEK